MVPHTGAPAELGYGVVANDFAEMTSGNEVSVGLQVKVKVTDCDSSAYPPEAQELVTPVHCPIGTGCENVR